MGKTAQKSKNSSRTPKRTDKVPPTESSSAKKSVGILPKSKDISRKTTHHTGKSFEAQSGADKRQNSAFSSAAARKSSVMVVREAYNFRKNEVPEVAPRKKSRTKKKPVDSSSPA